MQGLRSTLNHIGQQLGSMSINARLLIGALAIILGMTFFMVAQYTGSTDMSPLGLPNVTDVRARAVRYLETARVPFEDRGNDIYVPVSQRFTVLGQLGEQDIINAAQIDFNALIDQGSSPFISSARSRQMWMTAKMNVLAAMISARDDIARARVVIDEPPGLPGIGRANVPPTASVMITMQQGELSQDIADIISSMVAGAHAGMKAEHVTVTDAVSMRRFKARTGDSALAGTYLEHKLKTEQHFTNMIEQALQSIRGVTVTVNAVIRNTRETATVRQIDEPKIAPRMSDTREYQATNAAESAEPGVRSNVGVSLAGGGRTTQVTETTATDEKESRFGGSDRIIEDPTGYPLQVNAFVGVPKSYFIKLYADQQGDPAAEPDAVALQQIVLQKTTEWQENLALLIRTGQLEGAVPGDVRVQMIHDFDSLAGDATGEAMAVQGGIASVMGSPGLIQNIGLGALALLSVVMMFFMVKKATAPQALPTPAELAGIPASLQGAATDVVGEASDGHTPLDAIELDEQTMRMQQLVEQINEMIQSAPDESTGIFESWIASQQS
ncbi:MAG: hypothetical protein ACR2GY_00760 [Phycisphaerales bacterium]